MLACSGVLDRHPELQIVFVEFNVGWLAWTMETADFYTESFARYGMSRYNRPWITPTLPEPPSYYLRRQVHATFQYDSVGLHNIERTGAGALMWGNDYPHEEGTYPNSQELIKRLAEPLDDEQIAKVFRDNAARVFGFSDEVLATPV
jgi:predicted TIM-barrel fold metal-dependent hydrolase